MILAHGRDPMFPGWSDTAQLNAFNPKLRQAAAKTLIDIASQCDGVRCDMAMLLLNDIFAGTWNGYAGAPPEIEYWREIIPQVKAKYPHFMFVAEVYWDKEYEILQQGFDYAYDKTLYDRIMAGDVRKIRQHLVAELEYQQHMMRFVENHDEPRAYSLLGEQRSYAIATLICTLPGAVLLHDGQFSGRKVKLPVQIKRQPDEQPNTKLEAYYLKLLREVRDPIYQDGDWYLFDTAPAQRGQRLAQQSAGVWLVRKRQGLPPDRDQPDALSVAGAGRSLGVVVDRRERVAALRRDRRHEVRASRRRDGAGRIDNSARRLRIARLSF